MNPSDLSGIHPFSSVFQKSEAETVAQNIMKILERTGDKFRKLSWKEYKTERLKDGHFTEGEKKYFDEVKDYCLSARTARLFSKSWNK